MPVQILMPALSPTMTEGNLVRWLKKEGDSVKSGEVLAEIETDKATMEVEAVDEGTLAKIIVQAGTEGVQVNSLIALILEEDEDASALENFSAAPTPKAAPQPAQEQKQPDPSPTVVAVSTQGTERIFASPLAKRLAQQSSIDLNRVSGSGPQGRIVKADIEKTLKGKTTTQPPIAYGDSSYVEIPLNNIRKIIAKRLTEAKRDVPHFYLTVDCEIDALLQARSSLNKRFAPEKLSVNDFVIRACALALIKVPESNCAWFDTVIRRYQSADVSVAVAIDDGLVTPIIKSAEHKSLRDISSEIKLLAEKARAGKLRPEEFQGGTFTLSNLGMYGVKQFGAILNPPQACILAVGAGEQRPIIKNGVVTIATMMTCTLSVDHRAVDGAVGSRFLAAFKEFIEDPIQLLV